jgi:hypothetical protein
MGQPQAEVLGPPILLMPSTLGAQTPVLWHRHPYGARVGHCADTVPAYSLQSVCP